MWRKIVQFCKKRKRTLSLIFQKTETIHIKWQYFSQLSAFIHFTLLIDVKICFLLQLQVIILFSTYTFVWSNITCTIYKVFAYFIINLYKIVMNGKWNLYFTQSNQRVKDKDI